MQKAIEHEYKVLMTHSPVTKSNGEQHWRATLLDFPSIIEEAFTRDQVIDQIKARITDLLTHAEIITVHAPAVAIETNESNDQLALQGWSDHGLFKNDGTAFDIFEEIERERDNYLVGGA